MREHGHAPAWEEVKSGHQQGALAALTRSHFRQRCSMDGRDERPAKTVGEGGAGVPADSV
jgi:hypothetical protein